MAGPTFTIEPSSSRYQGEIERSASDASEIATFRRLILKDLFDAQAFVGQALKLLSSRIDVSISRDLELIDEQLSLISLNLQSGENEDLP